MNTQKFIFFICAVLVNTFVVTFSQNEQTNLSDNSTVVYFPLEGDFSDMKEDFHKIPEGKRCSTNNSRPISMARNGISGDDFRWKHLKFFMEGIWTFAEKRRFGVAVENMSKILPCVTFDKIDGPLDVHTPHVIVKYNENYCGATVGMIGIQQYQEYDRQCLVTIASILHAWAHTLGLGHEHSREDRDDYIDLYWDDIKPESRYLYAKLMEPEYSTYGIKYNPKSLMHFGEFDFGINGRRTFSFKNNPNIAPDKPVVFGPFTYLGLQWSDVEKLRAMYGCG